MAGVRANRADRGNRRRTRDARRRGKAGPSGRTPCGACCSITPVGKRFDFRPPLLLHQAKRRTVVAVADGLSVTQRRCLPPLRLRRLKPGASRHRPRLASSFHSRSVDADGRFSRNSGEQACRLGDLPDLRFRSTASRADVDDFRIDNHRAERLGERDGRGVQARVQSGAARVPLRSAVQVVRAHRVLFLMRRAARSMP